MDFYFQVNAVAGIFWLVVLMWWLLTSPHQGRHSPLQVIIVIGALGIFIIGLEIYFYILLEAFPVEGFELIFAGVPYLLWCLAPAVWMGFLGARYAYRSIRVGKYFFESILLMGVSVFVVVPPLHAPIIGPLGQMIIKPRVEEERMKSILWGLEHRIKEEFNARPVQGPQISWKERFYIRYPYMKRTDDINQMLGSVDPDVRRQGREFFQREGDELIDRLLNDISDPKGTARNEAGKRLSNLISPREKDGSLISLSRPVHETFSPRIRTQMFKTLQDILAQPKYSYRYDDLLSTTIKILQEVTDEEMRTDLVEILEGLDSKDTDKIQQVLV